MSKSALETQYNGGAKRLSRLFASGGRSWRACFYVGLWIFWVLLLGCALLLTYGWTQRYELIEQQAKQVLAERNIQAELKVISIGQESLRLEDVQLSDKLQGSAPPFFKADIIEARYDWQQVLKGQVKSLSFTRAKAVVEIDAAGNIIGGWVPPTQSGGENKLDLPSDGVAIKDSQLIVETPYGRVMTGIEAQIFDPTQFEIDLKLSETLLNYKNNAVQVGGPLSVKSGGKHGDTHIYEMSADLSFSDLLSSALKGSLGHMKADLSLTAIKDGWQVNGPLSMQIDDIDGEIITARSMSLSSRGVMNLLRAGETRELDNISYNGDIGIEAEGIELTAGLAAKSMSMSTSGDIGFSLADSAAPLWGRTIYKGDIDLRSDGVGLTDATQRKDLAGLLSLSEVLSKSPILKDFAPELMAQTQSLLEQVDVKATLRVDKKTDIMHVITPQDMLVSRGSQYWRIKPSDAGRLLSVHRGGDEGASYEAVSYFDMQKSSPLALDLSQASVNFSLDEAAKFTGNYAFSGQLALPQRWQTTDVDGREVSLSSPKTNVSFKRGGDQSQFSARSDFVLKGEVPGGYIDGARGQGRVDIETDGRFSTLMFTPSDRLSFTRMDLTSGWVLENGALELGAPFVMKGTPERRVIDVTAQEITMQVNDGDIRDFYTQMSRLTGQGVLFSADGRSVQDWDFTLENGRMTSELFPISNTDIFSPLTQMKLTMMEGELPEFDIHSLRTEVSSSLVSTDDIDVRATGTTETLIIDYDAKLFRFADPALPEIPMAGQARLNGARWTGESVARLPEDLTTPIDISFTFEDGVGEADINIEALDFSRNKLQPQNLVSNLRGKIGDVEGKVSTAIKLGFGEGVPLTSSGWAEVIDMDLGILAGPITGLNTSIEFTSFFPLETSGRQTVQVSSFDPGFPLANGEIEFELLPGKMKIHRAEWPFADGMIYIEPLIWDFSGASNKAVLVLDKVSIQDMVERAKDSKFEITGAVSGRLPITVSGVNVIVEDGKLSVPGGGVIRFTHAGTDLAGAQNRAAGIAFDALKNFEYQTLEADINGPLDGVIRLKTIFEGYNKKVFEGQPFEFDLELEGELLNLMRELNPETQKNRALSGDIVDLILKSAPASDVK